MKTTDEIVEEFDKQFGLKEDEFQTAYEKHIKDWLRTTLEEVRREERERIALTMSKMFGRELDWKMNPEQMQEALLSFIRPLTPTKTDKQ